MNCFQRCSFIALMIAYPACIHAFEQWSQAQPITVIMVDNRFQPDHVAFHADQPYQLRLENHGRDLHEFTAPAFFKSVAIRDGRLLANEGTDVVVQAGRSVEILLIPHAKGQYALTCADHDWDGMVGTITVD